MNCRRAVVLLLTVSMLSVGFSTEVVATVTVPTKRYLMSFHSCASGAANCAEPSSHLVQLAQSDDGRSWSLVTGWQSYNGSVPDVFRRGSKIYVMSVGGAPAYSTLELTRLDLTTGVVSRSTVVVSDGVGFVDPSLEQLSDGRLIVYYLVTGGPGYNPATCRAGESSCVKEIKSAVEVAGSDGTRFITDAGSRISETITPMQPFSDPDIFYNGREWVLYVSRAQSVHAYTSGTPQGSFVFRGVVSDGQGGIPAGLTVSANETWTYVHLASSNGTVIKFGTSADGTTSVRSFTTVVDSAMFGLGAVAASPGLALNVSGIECAACASASGTQGDESAKAASSVREGASCPRLGARAKSGKTRLICKKTGSKQLWARV